MLGKLAQIGPTSPGHTAIQLSTGWSPQLLRYVSFSEALPSLQHKQFLRIVPLFPFPSPSASSCLVGIASPHEVVSLNGKPHLQVGLEKIEFIMVQGETEVLYPRSHRAGQTQPGGPWPSSFGETFANTLRAKRTIGVAPPHSGVGPHLYLRCLIRCFPMETPHGLS